MADGLPPSKSTSPIKWLIPIGCLGAIIFCCGLPVSIGFIVFGAIKSSTPYQESLARVQASPEVQQILGQPIEPAFLVMGNIEVNGPSGQASLSYGISGPQGDATVVVDADKANSEWTFNVLKVLPTGGGDEIDLIVEADGDGPDAAASDESPIEDGMDDE